MQLLITLIILLSLCAATSNQSSGRLLALRRACSEGQLDVLLNLLGDEQKIDSTLEAAFLLHETTKRGYLDMTKILLGHYEFELDKVHLVLRESFVFLCKNGNIDFIKFVISEYPGAISDDTFDDALMAVIEIENIELLTILAMFKVVSAKASLVVLRLAAKCGSLEAFKLVAGNSKMKPRAYGKVCFVIACTHGNEDVMNWLIESGVEPSKNNNEGLRIAANNGHLPIVKRLLTFHTVLNGLDHVKVCRAALRADRAEVLEHLITQFTVASEYIRAFMLKACKQKEAKCLTMMLKSTAVAPKKDIIMEAIYNYNFKAVKALLQDGRIDPSKKNERILREACALKNFKLMKLLLEDGRVDPSSHNSLALNCLVNENGLNTDKCLRVVVRDIRIQHRIDDAVRVAVKNGNFESALLLYAHPLAMLRPIYFDLWDDLLEACKTGKLLNIIGDFLDIPLHFLEFIARCSLTHGHVYSFKFGLEEMLEEFPVQLEEMDAETAKRTEYNVLETIDYCIFWIITNDQCRNLLKYFGQTIQKYEFLGDSKKFPAVSSLHYIFRVHEVLLEIFRAVNLQDIAGIILQYHLVDFITTYRK